MWTPPTATAFFVRFPEFANAATDTVQAILDEAVGEVGESWVEKDRTPGVLHLAAHMLASQGSGVPGVGGGAAVTGAIKSYRVGDVSKEFAGVGTATNTALGQYYTTAYGRRYLELMRRSFPAVRVV